MPSTGHDIQKLGIRTSVFVVPDFVAPIYGSGRAIQKIA
jgi:hypothetical protein